MGPGMRRGVGPVVAPRPILEQIKEPRLDTVAIANGNNTNRFFANPLGAIDATAPGGTKTLTDTNLLRQGSLPTPQLFDIYALAVQWQHANTNLANIQDILNRGSLQYRIGEKDYLRIPLRIIPASLGINGFADASAAATAAFMNGLPSVQNLLDVTIPEELLDPETQRVYLTGRRVPLHQPSEQQFTLQMDWPGAVVLAPTPVRSHVYLMGVLKREVQ